MHEVRFYIELDRGYKIMKLWYNLWKNHIPHHFIYLFFNVIKDKIVIQITSQYGSHPHPPSPPPPIKQE